MVFCSEEKRVLQALSAYMSTIRSLDGGRYSSVTVPIPIVQKLLNFYDKNSGDPVVEESERGTDPKGSSIPPPPEIEKAMKTLARVWEPQVVSCAHCSAHMALQDMSRDLQAFIDIHEKCGDTERRAEAGAEYSLERIRQIRQEEFRGYVGGDPSGGELPPEEMP